MRKLLFLTAAYNGSSSRCGCGSEYAVQQGRGGVTRCGAEGLAPCRMNSSARARLLESAAK